MAFDRLTSGLRVGTLAGATSAGALVGLGYRHGAAAAPFELLGRAFAARWTGILPGDGAALTTGILLHGGWMLLWGICFAFFASRMRGVALVVAALLFAAFIGALAASVAPGALGAGTMASLSVAQTIFFLALVAAALAMGMRLSSDAR